MNHTLLYFIARLVTVFLKPTLILVLAAANNLVADNTAVAFVVTTLSMFLIQFDPHRHFYRNYFSLSSPGLRGPSLLRYRITVSYLAVLGALFAGLLFYLRVDDISGALGVGLFFLTEKVYDEALRFELFSKRLHVWGAYSLVRALVFFASSGVFFLDTNVLSSFSLFIFTYSTTTFAFFLFRFLNVTKPMIRIKSLVRTLVFAMKNCGHLKLYWLSSVCFLVTSNNDRLILYCMHIESVADFFVIMTIASTIPLTVEFFYSSLRRREILNGDLNDMTFLSSSRFLSIVALSVVLCGIGYVALCEMGIENIYLGYYQLLIILALHQLVLALSAVIKDVFYWHQSKERLLIVEVTTSVFAGFVIAIGGWLNFGLVLIFSLLVIVLSARALVFINFLRRRDGCFTEKCVAN